MKLWVRKGLDGHLHASMPETEEYLRQWKVGADFEVEIKMKRNGGHHRKGMGALRYVFDNQDRITCWESFLIDVKIATGHVDTHISADGVVYFIPRSIDFARMDELEFTRWKNDALTVVFERFIPTMAASEQQRVIDHLIGFL